MEGVFGVFQTRFPINCGKKPVSFVMYLSSVRMHQGESFQMEFVCGILYSELFTSEANFLIYSILFLFVPKITGTFTRIPTSFNYRLPQQVIYLSSLEIISVRYEMRPMISENLTLFHGRLQPNFKQCTVQSSLTIIAKLLLTQVKSYLLNQCIQYFLCVLHYEFKI